jgi:inhibitor of KinA sporulation pathway (predicted exonuclease)
MTGTGEFMRLWGYRSTQKCPRCGHHCKTVAHITMCTAPSAIEQWKTSLETLGKYLSKHHTHPGLTRFLLSGLLEWKTRTPRKALITVEHNLQELQYVQDETGWDTFMFGNISIMLQEIQAQFFREIGKQNSGLRWTSAFIQNMC